MQSPYDACLEQIRESIGHDSGVCALVAWMAVTGDKAKTAQRILEQSAGKTLTGWTRNHPNGGWPGMLQGLRDRGFNPIECDEFNGMTLNRFTQECDPQAQYWLMIKRGSHVIAVKNAQPIDWATKTRRFKINKAWRIERNSI